MKSSTAGLFLVLCLLCIARQTESYRILAVVATPAYSHQVPFRRLWLELHAHGHEVVLVTPNPIPGIKLPGFTQIDISKCYSMIRAVNFVQMRLDGVTWLNFLEDQLFDLSEDFCRIVFKSPEVKKLYAPDSNQTFDVLLTEFLYMPAICALAHRFQAHMIGLSSLGAITLNEYHFGGLVLPSHEYTWETDGDLRSNLPFTKRFSNFVKMWRMLYIMYHDIFPRHQKLAESFLGPIPPLQDIMTNTSLLFVDQSDVLTAARPKLANMVTFTSSHIVQNPDPLPKDLQKFLDGADAGFIYFSLGSNAQGADLPVEIQRMFCDVFAKLPYRVVWKFEKELPEKPANVYIDKWFSQQAILAHPKIKLFIMQGGLQSSEETIHFEVPVIVLPVLADQDYQASRMEDLGIGKRQDLRSLTRDNIENKILEVIADKGYKERINRVKNLTRDVPYDLVKNLVWWTEYLVRSDGAPHLRSKLALLPWYQYCDMDIVALLAIVIFLIVSSAFNVIARLIIYSYKRRQCASHQKQKIS